MAVQTSYANKPKTALKGTWADNGQAQAHDAEPAELSAAAVVGNLVLLTGPAAGDVDCASAAPLSALAVDTDAILLSAAAATTKQTITSLTGVIAGAVMNPARRITATLNSNANWDNTEIKINGEGWDGSPISETLLAPDAGAVTLTTSQFFRRVTSIEVDGQTSTAATYEIGVSADEGIYDPETVGVLIRDQSTEPLSGTNSDEYAAGEQVNVGKSGKMYVEVEASVSLKGGPAYLRTAASGGNIMGQWRGTAAAGFTAQPWATWVTTDDGATAKIAVLKKRL